MMRTCKFCRVAEGVTDVRGVAAHINRDGLCNTCYKLIRAVRNKPESVSYEWMAWYDSMCVVNMSQGYFVPTEARKRLGYEKPWRCKRCGTSRHFLADDHYKNYCLNCAKEIRRGRVFKK